MGAPVIFVMIILGIVMPFVTIVLLPLRVIHLLWRGQWLPRIGGLLLLVPWGYWLVPILKFGYVSTGSHNSVGYGTGPTIDPHNWLYLGLIWGIFEIFVQAAKPRATSDHSENQD